MKPIQLELSAIGPYVGPLVLDFRVLGDNRLFLLNGPTGSGKTMLLDAMCFALFGVATGEQRNPKSLRSQHAPANLPTEVTFDFALGNRRYRVSRQPEQERPRQRGTGMTTEQAKATLWDRTGLSDDSVDGEVMAARPTEVNAAVVEILGFTADQFRNVTVLPQGEFQRFLNAPSTDREQILEVLFQTGVYREMQAALLSREQDAARAVQAGRDSLAGVFRQAQVASQEELQTKLAALDAQLLAAGERLGALRDQRQAADAALNAARDADRRLSERREAETACDTLAKRNVEIQAKEKELDSARRAAPIEPVVHERDQRAAEATKADGEATKAQTALARADKQAKQTRQELISEEAREPERNEGLLQEQRLKDLAAKVEELGTARKGVQAAGIAHQQAEHHLAAAKQGLESRTNWIAQAEKQRDGLAVTASAVERLRADAADLDRVGGKRNDLTLARKRHSASERKFQLAAGNLKSAEQDCTSKRSVLDQLETRWLEAQAAVLAQSLIPGQPCPVCGSADHPAPAFSVEDLPSDLDRKHAREELAKAETTRDAARNNSSAAAIEGARTVGEIENLVRDLGAWVDVGDAEFTGRCESVRKALATAEDAEKQAAALKKQLETARTDLPARQQQRDTAEEACRAAASQLEAARAIERERADAIPAQYQNAEALAKALAIAKERVLHLQTTLQKVRNEAATADQNFSACRAQAEQAQKTAIDRRGDAATAAERFTRALQQGGFSDEAEFRQSLRSPGQIAALDTAIRQFQSALKAAEERLRRARDAAEGIAAPNLSGVEADLKRCEQELEDGVLKQDRLKRDSLQNGRWLGEAQQLAGTIEEAERKLRVISMLAQTANGRNSRRVTLQRFVQVTLLERVLAAATQRLQLMSSGRYWLQVALEGEDRRATAGLDLEVFDSHTGQARRVSTLSGGESFLASLALALGLSDTVQSHTGGYHLESIFIDEGFGTLDPDALELAMATLRDLQQGGRLVGIISHVPELRHQIDVRLDVTPLKRGSTARFVVAGTGSSGQPPRAAN
jgi:exonuclease SbcC